MSRVNDNGFTLVELVVTLAMSVIVIAAIYSAYTIQKKTYHNQDQVVEMQQNIRAGLDVMTRELRMAGYDPSDSAGATIVAANNRTINFTLDLNDDGDVADSNENITYSLAGADTDNDGAVDGGGVNSLQRKSTAAGVPQPLADQIAAIEFYYTLEDGTQKTSPTAAELEDIRTIQISVLARAGQRDAKYVNSNIYSPASGATWDLGAGAGVAPGDSFRRRMLTMTVQCRNMGL